MKASIFRKSAPVLVWMAAAISFCMLLVLSVSCRKCSCTPGPADDIHYMTRSLEGIF